MALGMQVVYIGGTIVTCMSTGEVDLGQAHASVQ